jgi:hypothetical protein
MGEGWGKGDGDCKGFPPTPTLPPPGGGSKNAADSCTVMDRGKDRPP